MYLSSLVYVNHPVLFSSANHLRLTKFSSSQSYSGYKQFPLKPSTLVLSLLPLHLLCQNLVPNGGDESSSKSCIMHYCIFHLFISPLYLSFSKSWKKECMAKFSKYSSAMIFVSIFFLELIYPCVIHKKTN